ncbi:hypothetical protein BsWGS_08823 [Bradybaena similaris]
MLKMGKTHFVLLVTVLLVDITQSVSTRSNEEPTKKEEAWKNISGEYYLIGKSLVNWTEAESLCLSYGAKLLETEDTTEYENIVRHLITDDTEEIWIGGTNEDGKWRWASNNALIDPNVPSKRNKNHDAGEYCLQLRRPNDFILSDSDCNERKPFICEKSR